MNAALFPLPLLGTHIKQPHQHKRNGVMLHSYHNMAYFDDIYIQNSSNSGKILKIRVHFFLIDYSDLPLQMVKCTIRVERKDKIFGTIQIDKLI